jgi:hypothetical protein
MCIVAKRLQLGFHGVLVALHVIATHTKPTFAAACYADLLPLRDNSPPCNITIFCPSRYLNTLVPQEFE